MVKLQFNQVDQQKFSVPFHTERTKHDEKHPGTNLHLNNGITILNRKFLPAMQFSCTGGKIKRHINPVS